MPSSLARRGTSALAALVLAVMAVLALNPSARADVYPPTAPSPTQTTISPTPPTDVGGVQVTRPTPTTEVAGVRLAVTGADALPYALGGAVLVLGGGALMLVTRRRRGASSH